VNCAAESRFEPGLVSEVDEPVRRYFTHALAPGAKLGYGVQLTMEGRIKAGAWLPFEAEWQGDGRSFEWRARAGRPFGPLRVVDHYAKGDARRLPRQHLAKPVRRTAVRRKTQPTLTAVRQPAIPAGPHHAATGVSRIRTTRNLHRPEGPPPARSPDEAYPS
jgi:hypothetical protein